MTTIIMKFLLILLILLPIIFTTQGVEQNAKKNPKSTEKTEPPKPTQFKDSKIDGTVILNECDEIKKKVLSDKCTPQEISIYSISYKNFAEHPDIEKETKIYRDWYAKMYKLLTLMYDVLYTAESAAEEQDNPKNKKIEETKRVEYRILLDKFDKLAKNPQKISGRPR